MSESQELKGKLEEWINKEGIPLEYFTEAVYNREGFATRQSYFIEDNATPREIDVLANVDYDLNGSHFRIESVVECKWTKDKPWIVFTSPSSLMHEGASITQSFGNNLGSAVLWHIAGEEALHNLELFNRKKLCGFSGRQSLTKDSDLFYNTVQSIISKTIQAVKKYDRVIIDPFEYVVLGFPLIVIEGSLFEAKYDNEGSKIELNTVGHSRLHWRGSSSWKFISTVDIVTKDHLGGYVKKLKKEFDTIAEFALPALENIKEFCNTKNPNILSHKAAPRGIQGMPAFLFQYGTANQSLGDRPL
jgi:hypothetical protein